jgi:hypothetical protein
MEIDSIMTDNSANKEILELAETLVGLKTASDAIAKESRKVSLKLNNIAERFITAYERFPHKYALLIKRESDWSDFSPLDQELRVSFSFIKAKDDRIHLRASFCYDPWEDLHSEINYEFPLDVLRYQSPHDYFIFEFFKNGLHKKDEFGFLVGATTDDILENKIDLYLGNSSDAKIAEPGFVNWIIKKIEDERVIQ